MSNGCTSCCLPWRECLGKSARAFSEEVSSNPCAASQGSAIDNSTSASNSRETVAQQGIAVFDWSALVANSDVRQRFCVDLAAKSFSAIALPEDIAADVYLVLDSATEFFALPSDQRRASGKLRLFRDKVVGYRELNGGASRFLEVHKLAGGACTVPRPLRPVGLVAAAAKAHVHLQSLARDIITWMAEHLGVPPEALLHCLDLPELENLEDGDCGSSVLRLGCYGHEPVDEGENAADISESVALREQAVAANTTKNNSGNDRLNMPHANAVDGNMVSFDEHTDASFLTLALVASKPGLQMRDPVDDSWLDVESGFGRSKNHLIVFIGDFLEVLTKGALVAARHRVVASNFSTPALSAETNCQCLDTAKSETARRDERRCAMPFLVRGQPSSQLNTAKYIDANPQAPLMKFEDMPYVQLRRFLDVKGRYRFSGKAVLALTERESKD